MLDRLIPRSPDRFGIAVAFLIILIGAPWGIETMQGWLEHAMGASTDDGKRPWYAIWPALEALALWMGPAAVMGALTTWAVRRYQGHDEEGRKDTTAPGQLSPSEERQAIASTATDWALRGVGYTSLIIGAVLFLMNLMNQSAWRENRDIAENLDAMNLVLMGSGARAGIALMAVACVCALLSLVRKKHREKKGELRIHETAPMVFEAKEASQEAVEVHESVEEVQHVGQS